MTTVRLALAGDTMLGRKVGARLAREGPLSLFSDEVLAAAHEADLLVVNLECAISERGAPWPDPAKPFFFRAPPVAAEALRALGVGCVTLANNHALDFGTVALLDTFRYLADAGIAWVGAGADVRAARQPAVLEVAGTRVGIFGVTDHPRAYAAAPGHAGVAYADLWRAAPPWLLDAVARPTADIVLVLAHWGPNMAAQPVPHVRRAAAALRQAGATLVAGHSAHVFPRVSDRVCYYLGDFVDDYATDPVLRNDLGLLFLVRFDDAVPTRIEAVPLHLGYCHTRLARGEERAWIARRFRRACAALGTEVHVDRARLVVDLTETSEAVVAASPAPRRDREGASDR